MVINITIGASLIGQLVKNLPAVQETLVRFLGWEDPLEKGTATHSSIQAGELHGLCSPCSQKESDTTELLSLSLIQSSFSALKIPVLQLFISPSMCQKIGNYRSFYHLHNFPLSKLYGRNYAVCSLFSLASFTSLYVFKVCHIFSWPASSFLLIFK